MNHKTTFNGGGIFLPLLAILFIALKLTGYIAWPWWWVLAPLWAPIGILLLILGIVLALSVIIWCVELFTGR
ncbi:hypothetical protein [Aminobacter sp. HY435]|uniref:hypothetical protein n=1 Tax=Aminobacter sp. HY435 TaxID=2970917 RepID=UPI0022B9465D|nr:hypothetical protein [Aminobacter sp. HY435]